PARWPPRARVPGAVATGEVDLGLVAGPAAPSDPLRLPDVAPLLTVGIAEEPLDVVLPVGHPLARRRGLRLADLADARWLDAPDAAVPLADLRTVTGRQDAFRRALRYDGADVGTLLTLVAAGHGLVLLPRSVTGGLPGSVTGGLPGGEGRWNGGDDIPATAPVVAPAVAPAVAPGIVAVPLAVPRLCHRVELLRPASLDPAAYGLEGLVGGG
ncbi:LysR substrate-binding domain-containing protein, partial [Streptomyces sp. NPDC003077]|uniref:LysR substrate-binding domain-containing protein n=1 Tax=Streptomyces sp. NPDC003077 TaxID=3154443 RepID=UPI0033A338AC